MLSGAQPLLIPSTQRTSMVIHLFKQVLGISNPFHDFTANITRISAILSSMEDNAKAANYNTVKEKTDAIKRMIGIPIASNSQCLIRLMQKKADKLHALHQSGEKTQLQTMEKDMHHALQQLIHYIVQIGNVSSELAKQTEKQRNSMLEQHINHARHYVIKMKARCHIEMKAYDAARNYKPQMHQAVHRKAA